MKTSFDSNRVGHSEGDVVAEDVVMDLPPLIHKQTIKDYERLYKPEELARSIITMEHESVLIRRPFGWTKDGVPIRNARNELDLEEVCEIHGWNIVARYGDHLAIVELSEKE